MQINFSEIQSKVDKLSKMQHIEILKIIRKHPETKLNENKNGTYINMAYLKQDTLEEIIKYIDYVQVQETSLSCVENEKLEIEKTYFFDK